MNSGEQFRQEYRKALSALRKAQRNRRGKRPQGLGKPDAGRLGYVRKPPHPPSSGDSP